MQQGRNEVVSHAASHFAFPPFFGDGGNAGAEVCATGQIEGLGNSTVCASASWDWSGYSGGQNALLFPGETERHPCALLNTTPHTFPPGNDFAGGFIAAATVAITTNNGDMIFGAVTGGSVCEIAVSAPPVCTTNEGVTTFAITGGTGKFSSATGSGILHSVVDFCASAFLLDEIFLHVQK